MTWGEALNGVIYALGAGGLTIIIKALIDAQNKPKLTEERAAQAEIQVAVSQASKDDDNLVESWGKYAAELTEYNKNLTDQNRNLVVQNRELAEQNDLLREQLAVARDQLAASREQLDLARFRHAAAVAYIRALRAQINAGEGPPPRPWPDDLTE